MMLLGHLLTGAGLLLIGIPAWFVARRSPHAPERRHIYPVSVLCVIGGAAQSAAYWFPNETSLVTGAALLLVGTVMYAAAPVIAAAPTAADVEARVEQERRRIAQDRERLEASKRQDAAFDARMADLWCRLPGGRPPPQFPVHA